MTNLLQAICNIVHAPNIFVNGSNRGRNRINAVGNSLEDFVKDIFANTLDHSNHHEEERIKIHTQVFSYIGNANNPPDLILKNGDAIEVKKVESTRSHIALNSSYPKSKILSSDPMITNACRLCERDWVEKDIIYTIGVVKGNNLKFLWLVYGDCYAADKQVYERVRNGICDGINQILDIQFAATNELGRVNKVDPLGITYLRIRGMWGIENPIGVYSYIDIDYDENADFQMIAIMKDSKFQSFPFAARQEIESLSLNKSLNMRDIQIKSPDNPAILLNSKIISYKR